MTRSVDFKSEEETECKAPKVINPFSRSLKGKLHGMGEFYEYARNELKANHNYKVNGMMKIMNTF